MYSLWSVRRCTDGQPEAAPLRTGVAKETPQLLHRFVLFPNSYAVPTSDRHDRRRPQMQSKGDAMDDFAGWVWIYEVPVAECGWYAVLQWDRSGKGLVPAAARYGDDGWGRNDLIVVRSQERFCSFDEAERASKGLPFCLPQAYCGAPKAAPPTHYHP